MRISDWSSDVCSSDLDDGGATWRPTGDLGGSGPVITAADGMVWAATEGGRFLRSEDGGTTWTPYRPPGSGRRDRKSVVEGKSVSVRGDLGGRRIINKKKSIDL